jgi:hypothetical protein
MATIRITNDLGFTDLQTYEIRSIAVLNFDSRIQKLFQFSSSDFAIDNRSIVINEKQFPFPRHWQNLHNDSE